MTNAYTLRYAVRKTYPHGMKIVPLTTVDCKTLDSWKKKHWLISRLCMKGFRLFFRIRFYCYSDYDIVIDFNFFGLRFFFCGFDQQFLWSCFFLFFVVDIFVCASVFFTLVSILKWTQMHEATSNAPISMTWAFKIPLRLHKSSVWMW